MPIYQGGFANVTEGGGTPPSVTTCWATSGRAFWGTRLIELLTRVVDYHAAGRARDSGADDERPRLGVPVLFQANAPTAARWRTQPS